MYSTKYAVSIHILSLIALKTESSITSEDIAHSVNTNPALVRRLMSDLKKAGLIQTQRRIGTTGLAKKPEDITLLEVFRAVENNPELFALHENPNTKCPVGAKIGSVLSQVNQSVQRSFETELDNLYLSDIIANF